MRLSNHARFPWRAHLTCVDARLSSLLQASQRGHRVFETKEHKLGFILILRIQGKSANLCGPDCRPDLRIAVDADEREVRRNQRQFTPLRQQHLIFHSCVLSHAYTSKQVLPVTAGDDKMLLLHIVVDEPVWKRLRPTYIEWIKGIVFAVALEYAT